MVNINNDGAIYDIIKLKEGVFEINSDLDCKINEYKIIKKSYEKKTIISVLFGCVLITSIVWVAIIEFLLAIIYGYQTFRINKEIKRLEGYSKINE